MSDVEPRVQPHLPVWGAHLRKMAQDARVLGLLEVDTQDAPDERIWQRLGTLPHSIQRHQFTDDALAGLSYDRLEAQTALLTATYVSNRYGTVSRLATPTGTTIELLSSGWAKMPSSTGDVEGWFVVEVWRDNFAGVVGLLKHAEPANNRLVLPQFGREAHGNFARSRVNRFLIEHAADIPDHVVLTLKQLHAPMSEHDFETGLVNVNRVEAFFSASAANDHEFPDHAAAVPAARLVKSALEAEGYAAEYMRALGFVDAAITGLGADGGVDVRAKAAVAQVKMEAVRTGRPAIQGLFGIAALEQSLPVFFSLAGYTKQALEWAEVAGVACFEFGFDGSIEPKTDSAKALVARRTV